MEMEKYLQMVAWIGNSGTNFSTQIGRQLCLDREF